MDGETRASFDGLEKLMKVQHDELKSYIGAVASNVREVRSDLQDHRENTTDAHGIKAEAKGRAAVYATIGALFGAASAGIAVVKFLAPLAAKVGP